MKNRVIKKIMAYLLVGAMVITTPMTASATESVLQDAYGEGSGSATDDDYDKLWSNSNSDTNTRTSTQGTVPIPDTVQKHQLNILGITLDKSEMELEVGKHDFLKARVLFDDWNAEDEEMSWVTKEEKEAIEKEIKWFSENPKIARVAWGGNAEIGNTLASVEAMSAGQTKVYAWIEADGYAYVNSNRPTAGDYVAEAIVTVVDGRYHVKFNEVSFAAGRNYDLKDYTYLSYYKLDEDNKTEIVTKEVNIKDSAEQVAFSNVQKLKADNTTEKVNGVKLSDDGILNINAKTSKLQPGDALCVDITTASGESTTGKINIIEANNVKKISFKGTKGAKEVFDMGADNADYHKAVVDEKTNKVISKEEVSKVIEDKAKESNQATGNNAYLSIEWEKSSDTNMPTDDFTWTSSNPNVVAVEAMRVNHPFTKDDKVIENKYASSAKLTAKNIGTSKITVTSASGKKTTLTVTVTATPAEIKINQAKDKEGNYIPIPAWTGKAINITATMYGANGMALPAEAAKAAKVKWEPAESNKNLKKNAKASNNKDFSGKVVPANVLIDKSGNSVEEINFQVKVAIKNTKLKLENGKDTDTVPVALKQSNIADITIDEIQKEETIQVIGRLPQTKSALRKLYVGKNTYNYKAAAYVPVGQKLVLAEGTDKEGIEDSIVWTVKNAKVATINDGKLTAVGAGKTDVTASYVSLKYDAKGKAKASVRKKTISVQVVQNATAISFAKEVQVINPKTSGDGSINATFTIKNVTPKKATYNVTDWKVLAVGPEGEDIRTFNLDGSKDIVNDKGEVVDAIKVDSRDKNGNLKKAAKITIPSSLAKKGTVIKVGAYTDGGAVAYGYLYITDKTTKITAELDSGKKDNKGKAYMNVGDTAKIKAYINNSTTPTESWKIIGSTDELTGENRPNTYVTEPVTYSLDKNSAKLIRVDNNGNVTALKNGKAKVTVSALSGKKTTVSFEVKVKGAN